MKPRMAIALIMIAVTASLAAVKFKYQFLKKRFDVVEKGQIYRGGWQTPRVLRRIVRDYHIRTILNVACNPAEQDAAGEGAVVREFGIGWHKILMPGTGRS